MLTFTLFDVGHGFCAYAVGPNGTNTLFDCGYDDEIHFCPSQYFPAIGVRTINRMVVSNFDGDHVSDLHNLRRVVNIETFFRNRSLSHDQLRTLKLQTGPLSTGMQTALDMHANWIYPAPVPTDYAGVELLTFYNNYPTFTDTNNLSAVSFLKYGGTSIVLPGDMETAGWKQLLTNEALRRELAGADVFVASHHGRTTGYCEEVFNYCAPAVVLISDKEIVHDTQENVYTKHARGITWNGDQQQKRYVLTTRSDGHMVLTKRPGQGFHIQVSKS